MDIMPYNTNQNEIIKNYIYYGTLLKSTLNNKCKKQKKIKNDLERNISRCKFINNSNNKPEFCIIRKKIIFQF